MVAKRRRDRELLFNGYRISVLKDGKGSRNWLYNNVNAPNAMHST